MMNYQPPIELHPPCDFSKVTIQDLIDRGLMHDGRMEEAAERAVNLFYSTL